MRRRNHFLSVALPFLLAYVAGCASTKRTTAQKPSATGGISTFVSREEMQLSLKRHLNDPRATYTILLKTHRSGLAEAAANFYLDMLQSSLRTSSASGLTARQLGLAHSAFAFSHALATSVEVNGPEKGLSQEAWQLTDLNHTEMANQSRKIALRTLGEAPEVWLQAGVGAYYADNPDGGTEITKREALELVRRAVRLSPSWAQSHHWLAQISLALAIRSDNTTKNRLLREAIASAQRAEKLQPRLRANSLPVYFHAYSGLGQPRKALHFLNIYIKDHSAFGREKWVKSWRSKLQKDVAAS